jgi:hypothetical protein
MAPHDRLNGEATVKLAFASSPNARLDARLRQRNGDRDAAEVCRSV